MKSTACEEDFANSETFNSKVRVWHGRVVPCGPTKAILTLASATVGTIGKKMLYCGG
jgi:hypothetical protein